MTDGLITRIGKWIDRKWQEKATEAQLECVQKAQIEGDELLSKQLRSISEGLNCVIAMIKESMTARDVLCSGHGNLIRQLQEALQTIDPKDLADLKTRMEKIELYAGMTRKVDPTKPPIAKSAFSM